MYRPVSPGCGTLSVDVDEIGGHRRVVRELLIGGDGIDQEEICAGQLARLVGAFGAANFFQRGHAHQSCQRLPVAFCAVVCDGAELQRAERGRSEGFARIENGEHAFGIAQDQACRPRC